ncbi:MAG: hypothetical protein NTY16_06605 [Deltaproteobacteria bacterium]|nr:hypothetical protein [Deltaproteobacteria bacterium]
MRLEQIRLATVLGKKAYRAGLRHVPGSDPELEKMLAGRKIGETPAGEASSIDIMKAWCLGWSKIWMRSNTNPESDRSWESR